MTNTPVSATCKQGPWAANHGDRRVASQIKWAVIHSAEAADQYGADHTSDNVAAFFARPSTQASTHLAVDRDSCTRMLGDLVIPWAAPGANTNGVHVEICGRAAWSRAEWTKPLWRPMLERAAYKVAVWCVLYNIPIRWVGKYQLRLGRKGLTTHNDVSQAWKNDTMHWDPGPGFPKDVFLQMVKGYAALVRMHQKP